MFGPGNELFVALCERLGPAKCVVLAVTELYIQAQFAMYVFPGETLRTEMWQQGPHKVIFQTRVLERNVLAITKAAIELRSNNAAKL